MRFKEGTKTEEEKLAELREYLKQISAFGIRKRIDLHIKNPRVLDNFNEAIALAREANLEQMAVDYMATCGAIYDAAKAADEFGLDSRPYYEQVIEYYAGQCDYRAASRVCAEAGLEERSEVYAKINSMVARNER